MVWYSHLLKNFQGFVVIHTVKVFGILINTEIGVFLELSCFFYDPADVGNLISGSSAFYKSSLRSEEHTSELQSPSAEILEPPKIKFVTVSIVSPSICHEVMGPGDMILSFLNAEF